MIKQKKFYEWVAHITYEGDRGRRYTGVVAKAPTKADAERQVKRCMRTSLYLQFDHEFEPKRWKIERIDRTKLNNIV